MRNPCVGTDLAFLQFIQGQAVFDFFAVIDVADCAGFRTEDR
jgi:hypothetical protein